MCRTFSHKTRREVKRLISVFFELLNNGSATCCLAFILFLLILVVFLFFLSVYSLSLSLSLSLPPSLTRFSIPPRFIISRVRQSAFKRTKKKTCVSLENGRRGISVTKQANLTAITRIMKALHKFYYVAYCFCPSWQFVVSMFIG